MASFSKGTSFTDGVTGDVTAAKLHALVDAATPVPGFITDRTAETSIATDDVVLISDTSESGALNKMTVANLMKAEITGTINSTAGTITTATIPTLTAGTTTGTAATFTSGTITTGVIPTLTSTTLITSGTGTAAAPAIVPTGDTNTGIFFPAADTIAFSEGGTESMRIDSSGNIGIGTASPSSILHISKTGAAFPSSSNPRIRLDETSSGRFGIIEFDSSTNLNIWGSDAGSGSIRFFNGTGSGTERLRIDSSGNVGIGTTTPSTYGLFSAIGSSNGFQNITFVNSSTGASAVSRIQIGTDVSNGAGQILMYGSQHSSLPNVMDINNATNSSLRLLTNNTERLRIGSDGQIGIGGANYGTSGQVLTSNGSGSAPSWQTNAPADGSITYAKLSTSATESSNVAKRTAKAWVNFNGSGTISIRSSFNVTSITDNGVGDYGVNFTSALDDANYSVSAIASKDAPASGSSSTISQNNARTSTSSQLCICSSASNNGAVATDPTTLTLSVFR